MTFKRDIFNENGGTKYDVPANLGKLKFMSLESHPIFKDGERVGEEITHANVYADKLGDTIRLKLSEGKTYPELPFMTDIKTTGEASVFIYEFDNVVGFGDNRQEIRDMGFSLRVGGYEKLAGNEPKAKADTPKAS